MSNHIWFSERLSKMVLHISIGNVGNGRHSLSPKETAILRSFHNFTVVKRTRVPAGYLVKMATDADVDSGRKRTLIQSVEAYTWNVLSGKIHGGIKNIQCKARLWGTFYHCTIAPRKNIFWRGCFVFMFCQCRGYLYFFTRVPGIFTRVPAL